MSWLDRKIPRRILLAILFCAAVLSVVRGAQNGYSRSQDFQWSGARMVLDRIDPWSDALAGDPLHRIVLTQNPNYLPLLYVLLAPLAALDRIPAQAVWVGCNILFAILSGWIAARFFGLSRFGAAATICALLASTPTRLTIGNGQQGLFVLFVWCLGLLTLRVTAARAAVTGVSYCKYNFAPPVVIYLWLRSGFRAVLYSLIPAAIGTILLWLWLPGAHNLRSLAWLIVAPLKLSGRGYFPNGGGANLMDVLELPLYAAHLSRSTIDPITLLLALAICIAILYRATRAPTSVQCQTALLSILSFGLFKHHTYDSVVLLFALCYLLRLRHHRAAQWALAALAYIWYAERIIDQLFPHAADWTYIPQFVLLMLIAHFILTLRTAESDTFPLPKV